MKKIILVVIVSVFLVQKNDAQVNSNFVKEKLSELGNDTVRYIDDVILSKRVQYVNKPFDSLLKVMPMPVVRFLNADSDRNRFIITGTQFIFYSYSDTQKRIEQRTDPLIITVEWEPVINKIELEAAGIGVRGGDWSGNVKNYFKNKIVKNVNIVKYKFKE